ncbi:hypothetical protein LTR35_015296 [Friedmanniomyces endolithicus]|uniref:Uncharacterized protein n=1 Tax=Friedmanniomyces endolithicus TaxID=329885 RepID=A0AAN6J1Z9_9PEZI|nr:hypothetical protein LTR35_015296 [Friedmanniomyces endolithicus]KAK0289234.1 hypothetical protein LTS00_009153 [Friedmanniomyces endolithicus]KAK0309598.1 hypothetical protein LTR82_015086 [Friedmanniomyces endolithicus]KAK0982733.1 hypothetical protein LTR54_014602 [Friedmanniomyces endolithicus]
MYNQMASITPSSMFAEFGYLEVQAGALKDLRCSRFKYQPAKRDTRPLRFDDIAGTKPAGAQLVINSDTFAVRYGVGKVKTINQRKPATKPSAAASRTVSTTPPQTPPRRRGFTAPVPSTPFGAKESDEDAFMLFPDLQRPYSALRNDTASYRAQAFAAQEAEANKVHKRGHSPIDRKDLIERTVHLGAYRTPGRPKRRAAVQKTPRTPIESVVADGSPMDMD